MTPGSRQKPYVNKKAGPEIIEGRLFQKEEDTSYGKNKNNSCEKQYVGTD